MRRVADLVATIALGGTLKHACLVDETIDPQLDAENADFPGAGRC